jgi:cytochrome b pre-mRNA-processing protein 3
MISLRSSARRRIAAELYATCVAAARAQELYRDFGVSDTIEGRYELIVLHVVLLLRRLGASGGKPSKIAQALVNFMAADLDRSIRELGVGDLSVGKFMRRLGEGLYGRGAVYNAALDSGDSSALQEALLRNVYDGAALGEGILVAMADYVHIQDRHLAGQQIAAIEAGHIEFLPSNGFSS